MRRIRVGRERIGLRRFRFVARQRPSEGVYPESCVMMARNLRRTSYDAQALRAGAIIAVPGGLCAEEVSRVERDH